MGAVPQDKIASTPMGMGGYRILRLHDIDEEKT